MRKLLLMGACLLGSAPLFASLAAAQDKAARQFSNRVGMPVSEAIELLNAEDHAQALTKLDSVLVAGGLTPYELANIHKMRGAALYEMDRLGAAITAFETAMKSGGLNSAETDELFVQTAQLMIATQRPAEGAQMIEDWAVRGGDGDAGAY